MTNPLLQHFDIRYSGVHGNSAFQTWLCSGQTKKTKNKEKLIYLFFFSKGAPGYQISAVNKVSTLREIVLILFILLKLGCIRVKDGWKHTERLWSREANVENRA